MSRAEQVHEALLAAMPEKTVTVADVEIGRLRKYLDRYGLDTEKLKDPAVRALAKKAIGGGEKLRPDDVAALKKQLGIK